MPWKHPTGKAPKSVCLVCLGPSKHSLLEMTSSHQPDPALMAVDEVWSLNGGANFFMGRVQYDVLWVLDFLQGEEAKEPTYTGYIRSYLERFPAVQLITSEADESWGPQVHEFPFADIANAVTKIGTRDSVWFRNSVPLIVFYAWWIGVETLYIFGADYHHEALKHREDDKGNAEAWLHWARMNGMKIVSSTDTTILDFNKPFAVYGYQRMPRWDAKTNSWQVGPSKRVPSLTELATEGGSPPNPHLPAQVRELLTVLDRQDEERLVELTAKVEAAKRCRQGGG
jgi:hypothetical protein